MNNFNFIIKAHYRLGVLERILRVVRHRGGYIKAMDMQENSDKTLNLNLALTSDRPAALLYAQLNKLLDIISIEQTDK